MSQIKAGDMVQLVFGCCTFVRSYIGYTNTVIGIIQAQDSCAICGVAQNGLFARFGVPGDGSFCLPVSWLIKIEPHAKEQTETTEETMEA